MKHFFITLYLLGISLFSSAQQEEKAALLITHYGSSDPQTRGGEEALQMNKESSKKASKHLTKADGVSDNEHYVKVITL